MPKVLKSAPNKAAAARQILAEHPGIEPAQMVDLLWREYGMRLGNGDGKKQAYNYIRTIQSEAKKPAPVNGQPASVEELIRLGNQLGWDRVREIADIAVQVKSK